MSKKIAVIGGSYLQRPLIEEILRQGHTPIVFSWTEDASLNKDVKYYCISVTEHDKIAEYCRKESVSAVVSIASDLTAISAAYVSELLGCVTTPYRTICETTDKYKMRERTKNIKIKSPKYMKITNIDQAMFIDMDFPLIIKPTDRSGSRGVTLVRDPSRLIESIERALSCSFTRSVIIESFIDGIEYSVETLTYNGIHQIIAITEKFTTGEPFFVELGHFQPTNINLKKQKEISGVCQEVLDVLGIKYGASHIELKIRPNGEIFLIEVGPRMGGDMIGSDLTYLSTGYNYLKNTINVSLGIEPESIDNEAHKTGVGICFILVDNDSIVSSVTEKKHDELVKIIKQGYNLKPGDKLVSVNDSSTRNGYIIYESSSFLNFNYFLEIDFCDK